MNRTGRIAKAAAEASHPYRPVAHCTGFACPLWVCRPYQIKGGKQ